MELRRQDDAINGTNVFSVYHIPEVCLSAPGLYPEEPRPFLIMTASRSETLSFVSLDASRGHALRKCSLDWTELNIGLSGS